MQDLEFIAKTIHTMTENVANTETVHKIMGLANDYARTMKFPKQKTDWTDEQLTKYFNLIEKLIDMPVEYSDIDFEGMDIQEKLKAVGLDSTDITPGLQDSSGIVGEVVNKMAEQAKYRKDLKCPYCKSMVYDNRNSKKSDKSPDFTCSSNDPVVCGGHTGKWRKSWWLDNSDIPEEWGI